MSPKEDSDLDFETRDKARPAYGRRIIRGLRIIISLLLDNIGNDRTSEWWRRLSPEYRKDVEHANEWLVRFLEWYQKENPDEDGTGQP